MSETSKGRKAMPSAEKEAPDIYNLIKDPNITIRTPYGPGITEEQKKDLFKKLNLVKTV